MRLLRGSARVEPAICARGGVMVKRLGDGMMAVFEDRGRRVEAALEARESRMEVGRGTGRGCAPAFTRQHAAARRLTTSGVDVNVAARVAGCRVRGRSPRFGEAARERIDESLGCGSSAAGSSAPRARRATCGCSPWPGTAEVRGSAILLVAASLALGACGGDDEQTSSSTSTVDKAVPDGAGEEARRFPTCPTAGP